jgi:hypothetical protein
MVQKEQREKCRSRIGTNMTNTVTITMKSMLMAMTKMTQHPSEKYEYFDTSHQNVT